MSGYPPNYPYGSYTQGQGQPKYYHSTSNTSGVPTSYHQVPPQVPRIHTTFHGGESRPSERAYTSSTSRHQRVNESFPVNYGHAFNVLAPRDQGRLEAVSASSTTPHGIIRTSDVRRDEGNSKLKYPCDECGKRFDRPSALEVHRASHTGTKSYPCPIPDCGKSFGVKSNMTRHLKNVHSGEEGGRGHSPTSIRSGTSRGSSRSASPYDYSPSSSSSRYYS